MFSFVLNQTGRACSQTKIWVISCELGRHQEATETKKRYRCWLKQLTLSVRLVEIRFRGAAACAFLRWRGNPCSGSEGCTQAVPRLYTGCTQAVPRLYPACTQAVRRLYPGRTQAVPRLYPNCTQAVPSWKTFPVADFWFFLFVLVSLFLWMMGGYRGGARNLPTGGLMLPTRGLTILVPEPWNQTEANRNRNRTVSTLLALRCNNYLD